MGAIAMSISGKAFAQEKPRSLASDPRIKVVSYQKNNVVPIHASNLINTQIIFGSNESIVNYQSGDSAAWSTNVNQYLRNVLNVKPTILGSNTDLDVITIDSAGKRRYYRFDLISHKTPKAQTQPTYVVQFVYPNEERAKVLAKLDLQRAEKKAVLNVSKDPNAYNWDYSFAGSRSIMPLHVFDDGKFTYMQLRQGQNVPAIFAVNNAKGEEAVVNFRRVGNYIVVQQVAPQFTLRDGRNAVASIFNTKMIAKIKRYG